jgi:hypothetical protein
MKLFIILSFICLFSTHSFSQKRSDQLLIGPELALPTGDFADVMKPAPGISVKGLLGFSDVSQFSLAAYYSRFTVKGLPSGISSNLSITPVMAGFRYYLNQFFIETQAGIGFYHIKLSNSANTATNTQSNFTFAETAGYQLKRWDFTIRYQQGNLKNAGTEVLSIVGINASYNLVRHSKKK